jgi:hypothetical protein
VGVFTTSCRDAKGSAAVVAVAAAAAELMEWPPSVAVKEVAEPGGAAKRRPKLRANARLEPEAEPKAKPGPDAT